MPCHYCPICGKGTDKHIESFPGCRESDLHQCSPKFVAAHDAAMDREEDTHGRRPTEAQRLAEGFRMLGQME
jgi:hypothetical protein